MAIRFVSVKCPECGAALDIEEGRKQIFCSYCGSKVIIENENEHIYRNIDEARIRQAETDRQVQLKKMEIIERKRAAAEKAKKTRLQLTVILVIVTLIFLGIGFGTDNLGLSMPGLVGIYILMFMWISSRDDKEDDDLDFGDKVRVPAAISDYENKSYAVIEAMFTNAGFHNIQCIPLNDLTMGLLKKPGMVESITINGRSVTSGGKKYSPDAAVVISYHSYRQGGDEVMKCRKCGAELAEGVLFCRECGAKVEKRKRFCSECGSELPEGVKFCPECGTKVSFAGNAEAGTPTQPSGEFQTEKSTAAGEWPETEIHLQGAGSKEDTDYQSLGDKIKAKAVSRWDSFDLFCKAAVVGMGTALLLFLTAIFSHRGLPIFISVLQIGGVAAAVLMHKNIIKSPKAWLKYVVLAAAFLFTVLNLMSYQTGRSGLEADASDQTTQAELSAEQKTSDTAETPPAVRTDYSIIKGSQYAFMSDEWNVYIASAISDSIIKIEHWNKGSSTTKKMSYSKDIGSYKINGPENGFAWLDDERTAFTFIFQDKGNSRVKKAAAHVFTVNVSDSDICKGTDYDERIACYSYTNDDWHMYRAIPLSEHLIKIECWSRSSSTDRFLFGWDWCVIDTDRKDKDFEWTDGEHTSFTMTTRDPENSSYWKEEKFVVFELENPGYKYPDVTTCLGLQIVGDDEAKTPNAASDYRHDDYKEVANRLSGAGFTNIRTEILYDIVLGWTSEGEVESVSIDGDTSFDKGAVFKKNAEIIITYHMKEEDDPSKKTAETETAETVKTESEDPGTDAAEESSKAEKEPALYYSTNGRDKAKEGNSGVYAYRNRGGQYYNYYVIDFDEGFVYFFSEGNGDESCERLRIQEGDLNEGVKVTYHDYGNTWDNYLHFKWKRQPDHLILVDHNRFEWDYYATDLTDALRIKAGKRISDY